MQEVVISHPKTLSPPPPQQKLTQHDCNQTKFEMGSSRTEVRHFTVLSHIARSKG